MRLKSSERFDFSMNRLNFKIEAKSPGTQARATTFETLHGKVTTPRFMPVATLGTVRAQRTETLAESGSQVLLSNTYHLMQRPGLDVLEKFGGIHKFMKWGGSVLTDSGGYQIFSLSKTREITDDGASFRSIVDGSMIHLTPEKSIAAQRAIGSDIWMVLDQCIDSTSSREDAVAAMNRTHAWAKRSLEARGDSPQAVFGIVQGACFEDLRKESAEFLSTLPFDGLAIGGLAVGESREERERITRATTPYMPENKPRYMMGVGTPIDLLEAVHSGVDMFDCILPTAFAQQGMAFTSLGRRVLRRGVYRDHQGPLDPNCPCPTCVKYDRAYLHHLIKSREILGWQLIGQHNLYFYHNLTRQMREAVFAGKFLEFYNQWRPILPADDLEFPVDHPVTKPKKLKDMPLQLGDFEVVDSPNGYSSIKQISSNETMHSVSDPWTEANGVYIDQIDWASLFEKRKKITIWDVGLGAATNALAVIKKVETLLKEMPDIAVEIISFENDLNPLRLVCLHPYKFKYAKHPGPFEILENKEWNSRDGKINWRLIEGDFLDEMDSAPSPDVILYDMFSFKTGTEHWDLECFERVRQKCDQTIFVTYTAATRNRATLLAAGFYVARGAPTGPKIETTIATTSKLMGFDYLSSDWLGRWNRSHVFCADLNPKIKNHPQFSKSVN